MMSFFDRLMTPRSWENDVLRAAMMGGAFLGFSLLSLGIHPFVGAIAINALVTLGFATRVERFRQRPRSFFGICLVLAALLLTVAWQNDPILLLRFISYGVLFYLALLAIERLLTLVEGDREPPTDFTWRYTGEQVVKAGLFLAASEGAIFLNDPSLWIVFFVVWHLGLRRATEYLLGPEGGLHPN